MGAKRANQKKQQLDENQNLITSDNLNESNSASSNKRLKTEQDSSLNGDVNDNKNIKESTNRQKIFTYDCQQLYECLLFHGISVKVCDLFLKNEIDGAKFKEWPSDNIEQFKEYIESNFKELINDDSSNKTGVLLNKKSFNNLCKHLFAIVKTYKKNPYPKRNKIICDCVHGQISLHPLLIKIIDTPQFQRLRYLKQLGIIYYIYPSANHTRFEHCIGTSHLAGLLIKHLRESQPSLGITYADELCVKIAGLCHDLGHGPFSHLFEEVIEKFETTENKDSWKHEMATLKLFDKMINENSDLSEEFECYGLFKEDQDFIKDLIYHPSFKKSNNDPENIDKILKDLESLKARGLDKSFLFEIVSNVRTGIDVDKFDYFQRDCTFLGCKNDFDHIRYINCTRVIKRNDDGLNQICVRDKEVNDLYQLYHVRHILTKRAYKHDTGSSINLMVVEALEKADKYFKFSTIFKGEDALDRYEKLNDDIFLQILYSTDQLLNESRGILQRIVKRNLYKHVSTLVLPLSDKEYSKKELESDFKAYLVEKKANGIVQLEDVVVEIIRLNYGSRNKNPVENVRYYSKYNLNKSFPIQKDEVSNMLLEKFEDNQLRIYSKNSDFEYVSELSEHFKKWCEQKGYKNKPLFDISISD